MYTANHTVKGEGGDAHAGKQAGEDPLPVHLSEGRPREAAGRGSTWTGRGPPGQPEFRSVYAEGL